MTGTETTIFLTRKQYDGMIEMYPAYMQAVWPRLAKVWGINGVKVYIPTDTQAAIELKEKTKLIKTFVS